MGLFSFLRRQPEPAPRKRKASAAAPLDPSAVEHARVRARRRLIGAAVLVLIAVIGFPLLFETAPRPLPTDVPIMIAGRDTAPAARAVNPVPAPLPATRPVAPAPVIEERADEAGRDVTATRPGAAASSAALRASEAPAVKASAPLRGGDKGPDRQLAKASEKPAEKSADKPAARTEDKAATERARAAEAAKAQALLEGRKPTAKAEEGGRFIVQVGAFTEAEALREARARVERLGLKTYTQEVVANGSRRTRVRVGPFPTREEADKAASRLKAAGLGAAVLTL
jgi:DedD protein